ncbi:hypothetical protein [Flexivirga endophytica]|nr:hypothetical protein [Flexivirga endophytica]
MCLAGAHHHQMQLLVQVDVIHEPSFSAQQLGVLAAFHGLPDIPLR